MNLSPPTGFSSEVDQVLMDIKQESIQQMQQLSALQHQDCYNIKAVPVTEIKACYKDTSNFHYYVYGTDNQVEIKPEWGYPAQMLCGCTII